ncbi:MAG: type II secretion system major pseudopilin GspG [Gammaproteobacteria bacterium]|jgi:general secretion pathway protein G|nr:type II secretion system major pseudopilin GspG [Gammaproteobacteria bacterium]MBT4810852.1 type II secretion system major pseudopilin GspG [Thiotrichales bacterium]MBT3718393.1 type II secretion system major pseudopilin GspG [Gammaproteobacteria bacterium]MBT4080983.1 type II secretion system major pseudopilin GspG [Gammaproteobacteria bacterium]MBT5370131.1 type II secretion system major pseudopilin GspG [Gammaproteobacteria bacterium]
MKKLQCSTKQRSAQTGFTLMEVMVVIVILGILATLVVPRVMERPEEARMTKARLDIQSIGQALDLYRLDTHDYPTTAQGLRALKEQPDGVTRWRKGGYLSKVPSDPWSNDYIYLSPGLHGDYDLLSYGADGQPGGEDSKADIGSWNLDG